MIEPVPDSKSTKALLEDEVNEDPIIQFRNWFEEAVNTGVTQPETMTLATCTKDGVPSARMVFLRGVDHRGFVFYTNYDSRKAMEISCHPAVALVLYWEPLHRQVRIEGTAEKTTEQESDDYFAGRPLGSQLGAWASPQSQILDGRKQLEELYQQAAIRHEHLESVPRPPYWGGYRVIPTVIEFWQGRPNRLHDRLRYQRCPEQHWRCERLAP